MNIEEFRKHGHELIDWICEYYKGIENFPVKSRVQPGEIKSWLPKSPPESGEDFKQIMSDFEEKILPGITHWQSPNFFAYFPANSSRPSVLAELLTATLGVQGMVWETSPAATEMEEVVMNWLKEMTGLPSSFHGVIQDTASTATLVAILSARERITEFQVNQIGFLTNKYRIYCSEEAHSSIDKAAKIAGFGKQALTKIETDEALRMIPEKLEEAIKNDIYEGLIPTCVVSAIGTTGTVAIDPLQEIATICKRYKVWHHVDAAYAGSAMVLEENRKYLQGIEEADSFVFNPHKWMFTNFDCSAYFVKDRDSLVKTFEIMPEYLKTGRDEQVNNYRDWGIQLGRRFRALKLWFVIRTFGVEDIKEKIRNHISWAGELAGEIRKDKSFILHEPQNLGLICFRLALPGIENLEERNKINMEFLDSINKTGKAYLSHTKVKEEFTLRMSVSQTDVTRDHVFKTWELIKQMAGQINA